MNTKHENTLYRANINVEMSNCMYILSQHSVVFQIIYDFNKSINDLKMTIYNQMITDHEIRIEFKKYGIKYSNVLLVYKGNELNGNETIMNSIKNVSWNVTKFTCFIVDYNTIQWKLSDNNKFIGNIYVGYNANSHYYMDNFVINAYSELRLKIPIEIVEIIVNYAETTKPIKEINFGYLVFNDDKVLSILNTIMEKLIYKTTVDSNGKRYLFPFHNINDISIWEFTDDHYMGFECTKHFNKKDRIINKTATHHIMSTNEISLCLIRDA